MARVESQETSRGVAKNIREDLKPLARRADDPEQAWTFVEKILSSKLEDFPGKFAASYPAIKDFSGIRWNLSRDGETALNNKKAEIMEEFQAKYTDEQLDQAVAAFAIISQIFSK